MLPHVRPIRYIHARAVVAFPPQAHAQPPKQEVVEEAHAGGSKMLSRYRDCGCKCTHTLCSSGTVVPPLCGRSAQRQQPGFRARRDWPSMLPSTSQKLKKRSYGHPQSGSAPPHSSVPATRRACPRSGAQDDQDDTPAGGHVALDENAHGLELIVEVRRWGLAREEVVRRERRSLLLTHPSSPKLAGALGRRSELCEQRQVVDGRVTEAENC